MIMRFKLKKREHKIGDLKQFTKFAWYPKRVEDCIIWLETYKSFCELSITRTIDFREKMTWVEYDRRLLETAF